MLHRSRFGLRVSILALAGVLLLGGMPFALAASDAPASGGGLFNVFNKPKVNADKANKPIHVNPGQKIVPSTDAPTTYPGKPYEQPAMRSLEVTDPADSEYVRVMEEARLAEEARQAAVNADMDRKASEAAARYEAMNVQIYAGEQQQAAGAGQAAAGGGAAPGAPAAGQAAAGTRPVVYDNKQQERKPNAPIRLFNPGQ